MGYVVAEILFESFPESNEGELSRLRAMLVNKTTLADIAREINLKEFIQLGTGERKSGGDDRDSILADAVEAIIAAIYLDGGVNACKAPIRRWMQSRISNYSSLEQQKDAKTRLQELMQAQGFRLPEYKIIEVSGEAHQQSFLVECIVESSNRPQQGSGLSKRHAEQQAALNMLAELEASS